MHRLAHIGITVENLARSTDFYTSVLGYTLTGTQEMENLKIVYLKSQDHTLELLKYATDPCSDRQNGRFDHIALRVPDIEREMDNLAACGVVFLSAAPRTTPRGQRIIFFKGPDGERIELVEDKKKEKE